MKALDKRITLSFNRNLSLTHFPPNTMKNEIFIRRMNKSIIHLFFSLMPRSTTMSFVKPLTEK